MTNNTTKAMTIKLLGKEYQVNCPAGEEYKLLNAADFLDQEMQKIREKGRVIGVERITVMAALNLAHELLEQQTNNSEKCQAIATRLTAMSEKLDRHTIQEGIDH